MKVLFVWNGPANPAGRSVLLRRELPLLRHLAADGVEPAVAMFGDPSRAREAFEAEGIAVHVVPVPLPPAPSSLKRLPSAVVRLRWLLLKLAPDVIEGLESIPSIAAGLAARRMRGRGAVIYVRQHPEAKFRIRAASRFAASLADRTIVLSEATRRAALRDDRTAPDFVEVATSGTLPARHVSREELAAARRSLGIGESARVIGVVSRLRHEKGVDVVIRALTSLRDLRDAHLVITGNGPEEAALRALAKEAPLPVHFVGHRDDVDLWYSLADVVAMPSRVESFGRVSAEAMASGRPLVASGVGGLAENVADGETGLLVKPDDPAAMAAGLRALLEDRERAQRMGDAARQRFESRFTIAHMAAARKQVWQRALATVRR